MNIAITCGDPSGVGPELIPVAVNNIESRDNAEITLIGDQSWLLRAESVIERSIKMVDLGRPDGFELGNPSLEGARLAIESLEAAAKGCLEGEFDAVVTGPISKDWVCRVGYEFPGQTEFFASRWGGIPTMGFAGEKLRVVLATWHVPLSEVPRALDRDALELAVYRARDLGRLIGCEQPRIGVCGLNPHAGENGVLGSEEKEWMNDCLADLRGEVPGVSACLPGDTVFRSALMGEFDVVVAAYHDQGLAPLKTLDFDTAVNVTLGLPFVRTSPDHGTAFDIAGKGMASFKSFKRAIDLAIQFTEQIRKTA